MERVSYIGENRMAIGNPHNERPLRDRRFKDLNPLEAGVEQVKPGKIYGPYIRTFYIIHYVLSGKGTFTVNERTYKVGPGQLFLMRPGDKTTHIADHQDPFRYVWIGFDGELARRFDTLPSCVITIDGTPFQEICNTLHENFAGWENMKEEYVVMMLHRIMALLFAAPPTGKHHASRVETYIRTSYMQDITVQSIAEVFNLDRRYLSRLFKERYGVTIQEYLVAVRLENAARLLREGHPVKESAEMCGYHERSHFSRMFYQRYGLWPREYAQKTK